MIALRSTWISGSVHPGDIDALHKLSEGFIAEEMKLMDAGKGLKIVFLVQLENFSSFFCSFQITSIF